MDPDPDAAFAVVAALHTGDATALRQLLESNPGLASSQLGGAFSTRTPLHVVTDWPGYFPHGPELVEILIEAGADPNANDPEKDVDETPLHWAASSDDVDVARALIDGGADLEIPNGSIGTPLDNAIGYACWNVARLLVDRGAVVAKLWHAAALGMLDRLEELLSDRNQTDSGDDAISQAFWHACAAGQRRAAELLLHHGADLNWIPDYADGTPLDAANGRGTRRDNVISWLGDLGARSSEPA
jgi:ankyrin repeat protein